MSALTRWGFDRAAGTRLRPNPLVRPIACAAPRRWPYRDHRTLAEVIAEETRSGAEVIAEEQLQETSAGEGTNSPRRADRDLDGAGCDGRAPEGTSGAPAETISDPANARQTRATPVAPSALPLRYLSAEGGLEDPERKPCDEAPAMEPRRRVEPVSRPAAGRTAAPAPPEPAHRPPAALDPDEEPGAVQPRQIRRPRVPDYARYAAALREQARPGPAPAPAAARNLPRAVSREECRSCGVPGFKGCEHQLPYEAEDPAALHTGRNAHRGRYEVDRRGAG